MRVIEEALCFDDVLLVPRYHDGGSRKDVDISTKISGIKLQTPIIAANMPSVSGLDMALAMHEAGGMAILDRMSSVGFTVSEILQFRDRYPQGNIGASIGIGDSWQEDALILIDNSVSLICIDVAHGNQKKVFEVYEKFRKLYPTFPLMIGNFATGIDWQKSRMYRDPYLSWKIGVGGGAMCTTRTNTGCGVPTFQSVLDFSEESNENLYAGNPVVTRMQRFESPGLIADGGIKNSGDIVKSLAAGAHAVMLGSLLAGTDEAPGSLIKDDKTGNKYKIYRGNASFGSKVEAGLKSEFIEGAEMLVKYKGPVRNVLDKLKDGIRSGFTYCGVSNIEDLQKNSKFVKVSSSGHREGLPHGIL